MPSIAASLALGTYFLTFPVVCHGFRVPWLSCAVAFVCRGFASCEWIARARSSRLRFSCVDPRSATHTYLPRLLARHHALHQPDDDREDRATGTTADNLTKNGPDVEVAASRGCDRRDRGLQKLTAADAAKGACDRVANAAEIIVLQGCAGGVTTDDSRDQLNDQ
jgi:hypothetical protein